MAKKDLKIEDIGEIGFIQAIKDNCHFSHKKLIKGIGDDCAVIGPYGNKVLLITTDSLLENVHFIREKIPPEHLGQKAAAVNFSDIAAMGGKALHLFLSLAIPESTSVKTLLDIYRGIKMMCRRHRVNIMGGDTTASPDGLMINVTVIGEAHEKEVLYRNGARPGHGVYVTGSLGDSAAGLKLIREEACAPEALASTLKAAHNLPVPFLEAGLFIARSRLASSMIDLSDGLLSDLKHICEASGVGATLFHADLPISKELISLARANNFDPHELAISGGEDYKLLVTVPQINAEPFEKMFEHGVPCQIHRVGEIKKNMGIKIIAPNGTEKKMKLAGFEHFLRS